MNNRPIQNKLYIFFRKLYSFIPLKTRLKIKYTKLPFGLDFFKWLFIDFARPNYFHPYGLFFFVGQAGKGKTISLTKKLNDLRFKYKDKIYIASNYGYKYQDFSINNIHDLLKDYDKPIIFGYDEMQNDFDSRNWGSLSTALKEKLHQTRKHNGMMVFGTAQKFAHLDKRLRDLTHMVYQCNTIFSRLTFFKAYEPQIVEKLEEGSLVEKQQNYFKYIRFFVQTDDLRDNYSSYELTKRLVLQVKEEQTQQNQLLHTLKRISARTD